MIKVTDRIFLHGSELVQRFVRAGGPRGQHLNKTSTACELRFDGRLDPRARRGPPGEAITKRDKPVQAIRLPEDILRADRSPAAG